MTREEAIGNLIHAIRWNDMPKKEALDMAVDALKQEPCDVPDINVGDMISREAVLDAMYELCDTGETLKENPWRDNPHIDAIVDTIERLPSVAPHPKIGHWIRMKAYEKWGCSECNTAFRFTFKEHDYCPKCGTKMVEPQESEDI